MGVTVWDFAGEAGPVSLFWRAVRMVDPAATDESDLPGTAAGQLADLLERAGLRAIESTVLTVSVEFSSFEQWWEPFTLGVGPAGNYLAGLDDQRRASLRQACADMPADVPFTVSARAWTALGQV